MKMLVTILKISSQDEACLHTQHYQQYQSHPPILPAAPPNLPVTFLTIKLMFVILEKTIKIPTVSYRVSRSSF